MLSLREVMAFWSQKSWFLAGFKSSLLSLLNIQDDDILDVGLDAKINHKCPTY